MTGILDDTPAGSIMRLDAALARRGQTITLRRLGSPPTDVVMKANVRGLKPEELVGDLEQGVGKIVISPSQIGAFPLPVKGGDKVLLAGGIIKTVQPSPNHIYMADVLVRIDMLVSG